MLSSRVFAYTVYPELRGEPRSADQNSRRSFAIPTTAAACPIRSRHFSASLSPFKINTYETPHKCCIQRTYRITKFFRINTYKKHGGRGVLWLTRNPIRISILLALSFEGSDQRESKDLSSHPTSGPVLPSLSSLFAPRAFHNSFAINLFPTLSENCRGVTLQFPIWELFAGHFAERSFFSPFPFNRLHTLLSSVSRKSFACHSYENCRVCTNNSHSGTQFLKDYFNCGRISGGINHLQGTTAAGREKSLPSLSTLSCQLSTASSGSSMLPVIRGRSDAHAPKLVAIILLEEHVPLFAALKNFFLLRRDLFADFQLHLLFFLQRSRQDQHHLLPDGVPVVHKFHVVARHQHFRNLVRQSHDLFPAKSHSRSHFLLSSFCLLLCRFRSFSFALSSFCFLIYSFRRFYSPISSFCFLVSALQFLSEDQFAILCQLLLRFLVHLLVRNARAPHFVLMHDQELPHFLVEPVFHGEFFHHPQPHAMRHRVSRLRFNVAAFHQALHHFLGHVRHVIPDNQHLYAFPLRMYKKTSLLAARTKCKEPREFPRKLTPFSASPPADCCAIWQSILGEKTNLPARMNHSRRRVDPAHRFLYDEEELVGRLAQRLERSVYTRKVVRSNRTVPTIVTLHPSAGT